MRLLLLLALSCFLLSCTSISPETQEALDDMAYPFVMYENTRDEGIAPETHEENIRTILKEYFLGHSQEHLENALALMLNPPADHDYNYTDSFIALCREVFLWAEKEKALPGDQLYQRALQHKHSQQDNDFYYAYLKLAAAKKFLPAMIEKSLETFDPDDPNSRPYDLGSLAKDNNLLEAQIALAEIYETHFTPRNKNYFSYAIYWYLTALKHEDITLEQYRYIEQKLQYLKKQAPDEYKFAYNCHLPDCEIIDF